MNSTFDWRDMLRFDKMIAPTFLTILYYIHITVSVLASLWFIMKGMDTSYGGGFMVMSGLAGLVVGPFVIRLFYELLIVIFKIHTRLSNIDYTLLGQPTGELLSDSPRPSPVPSPTHPFEQPGGSIPTPYQASFSPAEQTSFTRATPPLIPAPILQQPIGFQVSTAETPLPDPSVAAGQPMPDFWTTTNMPPPAAPVPPVELGSILQKMPNWPVVLATLVVLYAILTPYAVIGDGSSASFGQLVGPTYAIKNSSLGIIVVLSGIVMLVTSAGGLKQLWFVGAYGLTLLGSVFAFLDDNSLFSQVSKAKATMSGIGYTLGRFIPQADQLTHQMTDNIPSAAQFLTPTFYLFILAMLFLIYWASTGKYQERGLITPNPR